MIKERLKNRSEYTSQDGRATPKKKVKMASAMLMTLFMANFADRK